MAVEPMSIERFRVLFRIQETDFNESEILDEIRAAIEERDKLRESLRQITDKFSI